MALTADKLDRRIENADGGYVQALNVAASEAIYIGGAVFRDVAGNAVAISAAAVNPFLGIADTGYDNTAIAATPTKPIVVRYGHIEQVTLTVTVADIGKLVYATDDNTFTLTGGANVVVGRVYDVGTVSGTARVDFQRYNGLV